MKCHQCDRLAIFGYGDPPIPLCLDCSVKYQTHMARTADMIAAQINSTLDGVEMTVGIPNLGARVPRLTPTNVLNGPLHLHHVQISDSNVGVVNSGSIGSIDHAVGILQQGQNDAADALKRLTEAVAAADDLTPEDKSRVLEALSVVATEAVAPPEQRRKVAMMALLKDAGLVLSTSKTLADLATMLFPAIATLFG